jgi:hypothetical protein
VAVLARRPVGAAPKPAVQLAFQGVKEVHTHDICLRFFLLSCTEKGVAGGAKILHPPPPHTHTHTHTPPPPPPPHTHTHTTTASQPPLFPSSHHTSVLRLHHLLKLCGIPQLHRVSRLVFITAVRIDTAGDSQKGVRTNKKWLLGVTACERLQVLA